MRRENGRRREKREECEEACCREYAELVRKKMMRLRRWWLALVSMSPFFFCGLSLLCVCSRGFLAFLGFGIFGG